MAVSPVRALLAAHLQATVNRSRKELGKVGATLLAVLLLLFALLALVLGSAVIGWVVGGVLGQPKGVYILGGLLTVLSAGGGIAAGVLGGTRALDWESYRVFPLRFRSLFAGELLAGLGDSLPLILAISTTAFLLGIAFAHPVLLPLLVLLSIASTLVLLLLQLLAGFLAAAAVKRLQVGLLLLALGAWAASVLSFRFPSGAGKGPGIAMDTARIGELKSLGRSLLRLLDALPATQAAQALAEAARGAWALSREGPAATRSLTVGPAERLWSFRTPVDGLARLHWRTLLTSHVGKFGFLIPLMTVVLLKGPLAQVKHQETWGLPAAFLYLGLTAAQMQFNQFGLDGHGVKALLLLPVSARQLLAGKCLGLAAYQAAQALLLALLLALLGTWTAATMAAALLMAGCVFLAQAGLGHWTSAWLPRPMPRDSLKNSNLALPVKFLGVAASTAFAGMFGGAYALLAWLAPAWLVAGMGLLFGLMVVAYRSVLPKAADYLDRRREQVLAALG